MCDNPKSAQNGITKICPRCGSEFIILKGTRGRPRKFCRDKCTREFYEKDGKTGRGPKRDREAAPSNSGHWDGPTAVSATGKRVNVGDLSAIGATKESELQPHGARFDRFRPGAGGSAVTDLLGLFDGAVQIQDADRDRARKRRERRRQWEVMPEWAGWLEFDGGNPSEGSTSSRALRVIGSARPWNA